MSAGIVEKALTDSLGYLPVLTSIAAENGLLIGSAAVPPDVDPDIPDEEGAPIDFVIDPARRAMVIRIDGHEPCFVHPIDGPASMVMRMACSISDEGEWGDIRDGGDAMAMALLFNGQPDPKGALTFDALKIEPVGDVALVELTATSNDRAATARLARELRAQDGWVPENFRDAIFEIGVGSSDAPCPIEMGYEIDSLEKWLPALDRFPQARAAVGIARDSGAAGNFLLHEIVEGDMAIARVKWEGTFPDMISVDTNGIIHRLSPNTMLTQLPDDTPAMEP